MIKTLLRAAGIPGMPDRYPDPPAVTFAVYFDAVGTDGPDGLNFLYNHDVMVELYEPTRDDAAEEAIETQLNAQGVPWTKQARYWLKDIQRYQVVYEFSYTEKRRT